MELIINHGSIITVSNGLDSVSSLNYNSQACLLNAGTLTVFKPKF